MKMSVWNDKQMRDSPVIRDFAIDPLNAPMDLACQCGGGKSYDFLVLATGAYRAGSGIMLSFFPLADLMVPAASSSGYVRHTPIGLASDTSVKCPDFWGFTQFQFGCDGSFIVYRTEKSMRQLFGKVNTCCIGKFR